MCLYSVLNLPLVQVIKYYADKVISLKADKALPEVAKDIDRALHI